jgi:hypothetical protein
LVVGKMTSPADEVKESEQFYIERDLDIEREERFEDD